MAKTIFEEMGGTYVRQGDYFIPCLTLPAEKENKPIGVWGKRLKRYLKNIIFQLRNTQAEFYCKSECSSV